VDALALTTTTHVGERLVSDGELGRVGHIELQGNDRENDSGPLAMSWKRAGAGSWIGEF
jgi:hypothetical protein